MDELFKLGKHRLPENRPPEVLQEMVEIIELLIFGFALFQLNERTNRTSLTVEAISAKKIGYWALMYGCVRLDK